jgi:hypothetical protein
MDEEAMEDEARAESERKLLAVFQERLRAHACKLSKADALAFLRKQKKLLIRAAFSVPPGSDAQVIGIARGAVLDTAAANAPKSMTRRAPRTGGNWSPGQPHPRHADRKTLAAIISHEFFPISPRSLERWPLQVRQVNGRALYVSKDALAMAEATMAAARVYKQADRIASQAADTEKPRRS